MKTRTIPFIAALLLLNLFALKLPAQNINVDSLENVVRTGKGERPFSALSKLTLYYQNSDVAKAFEYAKKQNNLAKQQQNLFWQADALENIGTLQFYQGTTDSAKYYYKAAYLLWENLDKKDEMFCLLSNIAVLYRIEMKYDSALISFQKVLDYFEQKKDDERISQVLANIAIVYNEMENAQKHDEYTFKALKIQERIGSKRSQGISLANLSTSFYGQNRYKEAAEYGERAVNIFREIEEPFFVGGSLVRAATAILEYDKNDKRLVPYLNEATEIADNVGSIPLKQEALKLKSRYYFVHKNYTMALANAQDALEITDTTNNEEIIRVYDLLVQASIMAGEREKALDYYNKYVDLKIFFTRKEWLDKISEMEVKYETEKKELKISALEEEKRLTLWLGIIAAALLLSISTGLFFMYKYSKNKKKLAEQQVKQLEQEKQLVATQSVLDGETAERTRLARDLHDGLGGMLSVVKLGLNALKPGAALEGEDVQRFSKAMGLLDDSIRELRRISHNMMPESLMRYGLKASLSDFCGEIPIAMFHYYGKEERLDSKLEIMIYRTAHELVNNALKYAQATQINVQIVQEAERIALTVQDNGKGFDTTAETKGTGLSNIRNRAESFNGHMDIWSEIGKGTEAIVEFKVSN